MKNLIITLCFALFWTSGLLGQSADTTASIKDKVRELMTVMQQKNRFENAVDTMIKIQREENITILGEDFFDALRIKMKKEGFDTLVKMQSDVYQKYFTVKELDALIKFYKTPEGNAVLQKMSLAAIELTKTTDIWGKKVAKEILEDLRLKKIEKFNLEIEANCSQFKAGKFFMMDESDNKKITIVRKGTIQTETSGEKTLKFKIKWLRNNRYSIQQWEDKKGEKVLIVNIYEATENSYKFIAAFDDDYFMTGEVFIEK
jgi:hypothetical protein